MKKLLTILLVAGAIQSFAQTSPIKTIDTASYGFGVSLGGSLKNSGLKEVNLDLIFQGIKDSFGSGTLKYTNEETQAAIEKIFERLSKDRFSAQIMENEAYLAKNKTAEGVKTTASGIQYQVLKEGTGAKPLASDTVTVHYSGKLTNGEEFDSSYERGEPATFPLNRVIPGWSESVSLMNKGAKYRFWIPADLGYGERGAGDAIPPYSVLIFEIELLDFTSKL